MSLPRRIVALGLRALRERLEVTPGAPPAPAPPPVDRVAPALRPEDVRIDAAQLVRQHGIGVEVAFVDLRDPDVVAATGTLPDARLLTARQIEADWAEVADEITVLVDADGHVATALALRLRAAGHAHAWALDGGFDAWRRAGGEIDAA